MSSTRWATFDCYGTLIDWNRGIGTTLERLWPKEDVAWLLARYHQLEPAVERETPTSSYRAVMARCLRTLAEEHGLPLGAGDADALARSLPHWPAFREVQATLTEVRKRGWKLAILSNIDSDLLHASLQQIGVAFDGLVIASEIGSYKPAPAHWTEFASRTGATPNEHVHVGASLYHDIAPAMALGLRTVWINRLEEVADGGVVPTRELPDLNGLPGALDGLVG